MKRGRGFTLIEILAALTMFAVVGGMLLQLFESGLRSTRKSAEMTHGVLLARSKMTELLAYPQLAPGTLVGEFDDGYSWRADLFQPVDEGRGYGSLQPLFLTINVYWGDSADESSFTLQTLTFSSDAEGP
jgi:prepilin-type N-terminal cleavage/methylation domain-containing protein